MTTYLISYDLAEPERDYAALEKAIQNYGAYCHLQKSVWLIVCEVGVTAIRDDLKTCLDANDKLFIAKVSSPAAWEGAYDEAIPSWLKSFL